MQPASRAALSSARERLEERVADLSADALTTLGLELGEIAAALDRELALRRHLADASAPEQARQQLAQSLFGGKVSGETLETVRELVALRWSRPVDVVDGIEALARQALLTRAEREDALEEVEDELFRFGRILDAEPRLATLLADHTAPAERRVGLLDTVLAERVQPVTRQLIEQAVRAPRRRHLDQIVEELVNLAAAQRQRSVAHVTAGGPLTPQQEQRLLDVLSRIYRRPISLKVELNSELLGGLVIRVGDEVIDGSVAGRLEKAYQWLPR